MAKGLEQNVLVLFLCKLSTYIIIKYAKYFLENSICYMIAFKIKVSRC